METSQSLVVRRVHQLEPQSRPIHGWQELHNWWLENALTHLLDSYQLCAGITEVDARHLRENAWSSIKVSARQFVEIRNALRPIVRRFERYRNLEPKLNEWCRAFVVVVGGSIGRFESEPDSDADLAIIVDSDNLKRCYEVILGLIIWPLKLKLLEGRVQRKLEGQKLITDKLVFCFDYRTVLPDSSDDSKYHHIRRLLLCGLPLHNTRKFRRYLAPYHADGRNLPRQALAAEMYEEIQRQFAKVIDRGLDHRYFWRSWIKFVRLCLMGLAIKYLDAREWNLNYFTLAELLRARGVFQDNDWRTIQRAVAWALYARNNRGTSPIDNGQAIFALKSFQDLHDVTQRLPSCTSSK